MRDFEIQPLASRCVGVAQLHPVSLGAILSFENSCSRTDDSSCNSNGDKNHEFKERCPTTAAVVDDVRQASGAVCHGLVLTHKDATLAPKGGAAISIALLVLFLFDIARE